MKKIVATVVALWLAFAGATAQPVPAGEMHDAALRFWNTYRPKGMPAADRMVAHALAEFPHLAVWTLPDDSAGFVVMSSDRRVLPVLAYSYDGLFSPSAMSPAQRWWLMGYEQQVAALPAAGEGETAHPLWTELLEPKAPLVPKSVGGVPALLQTQWNQSPYFNDLCPYDSVYHDRTVVGCTATAMAQVMKYWNHPSCGVGTHTYHHRRLGNLSADFGNTTYMWEDMPNTLSMTSNLVGRRAAALLSYHCGVAVDMDYGVSAVGGSGAWVLPDWDSACAAVALWKYFKYDPSLHGEHRSHFSDSAWKAMIDDDIYAGRPILYSGYDSSAGHAFVLDGADTMGRYHFNWGWGGYGDGFYYFYNLNPGGSNVGSNLTSTFNMAQQAVFGIKPVPEVFDSVDIYDTFCIGTIENYPFYEYTLPAQPGVYVCRHLSTIYSVHLSRLEKKNVRFQANGGEGVMPLVRFCPGDSIVIPECEFTREGYSFAGWCRSSSGIGDYYQPNTQVLLGSSVMLYAVWLRSAVLNGEGTLAVDSPSGDQPVPFELYPNPVVDHVALRVESEAAAVLFDAFGRRVASVRCAAGEVAKIDLSDYPAGCYFVRIVVGDRVYNRPIIKR